LRKIRRGESPNTPITIVDIAAVLIAEQTNGAMIAQAEALREHLRRRVSSLTDLHAHHATFMSTLATLTTIGQEPAFAVELIFIGTLPPEWRDIAFGPMHAPGAARVSGHDNICVSSWRLIERPAASPSAHAVAVEDSDRADHRERTTWHARGPPTPTDAGRGGRAPPSSQAPSATQELRGAPTSATFWKPDGPARTQPIIKSKNWKLCPRSSSIR
jgi:hypothetical protein